MNIFAAFSKLEWTLTQKKKKGRSGSAPQIFPSTFWANGAAASAILFILSLLFFIFTATLTVWRIKDPKCSPPHALTFVFASSAYEIWLPKKKNLYLLNYCRPFPNCTFTSSNKVPSTTIWAVCFITLTFLIIILISTSPVCPPPITVGSCVTMFLTAVTSERGRDILSYPIGQICNINRTRKYIASKLN